jgi:hypothetical protein
VVFAAGALVVFADGDRRRSPKTLIAEVVDACCRQAASPASASTPALSAELHLPSPRAIPALRIGVVYVIVNAISPVAPTIAFKQPSNTAAAQGHPEFDRAAINDEDIPMIGNDPIIPNERTGLAFANVEGARWGRDQPVTFSAIFFTSPARHWSCPCVGRHVFTLRAHVSSGLSVQALHQPQDKRAMLSSTREGGDAAERRDRSASPPYGRRLPFVVSNRQGFQRGARATRRPRTGMSPSSEPATGGMLCSDCRIRPPSGDAPGGGV